MSINSHSSTCKFYFVPNHQNTEYRDTKFNISRFPEYFILLNASNYLLMTVIYLNGAITCIAIGHFKSAPEGNVGFTGITLMFFIYSQITSTVLVKINLHVITGYYFLFLDIAFF